MQNKIITGIAVVVAVAIVGYFFVPKFITGGSVQSAADTQAAAAAAQTAADAQAQAQAPAAQDVSLPSGVVYRDEVVGTSTEAKAGSTVTVNYIGALSTGQVFDSSSAHGQPFSFTLGSGQVIKGWDEAVAGMKVGGKRLMQIPANMAYGAKAVQGKDKAGKTIDVIPANSTLIFEVELLAVK